MCLNGFRDVDRSVRHHGCFGLKIFNADLARGYRGCPWKTKNKEENNEQRQRCACNNPMVAAHIEVAASNHAVGVLKLTLGASRSAGADTSKNSRGLNPSMPAKIFVGNCWILVFRSRTTALL